MNVVDIQSFSVYFMTNSDYLRWFPVLPKRISVLVTSFAVLVGGLTFGAAPASAAISGAGIDPSTWAAGSSQQAVVEWAESTGSTTATDANSRRQYSINSGSSGEYISVEVGWGWTLQGRTNSGTIASYEAIWNNTASSYTCSGVGSPSVVFSSTGFGNSGGNVKCLVKRSTMGPTSPSGSSSDPGQQVVLGNGSSSYFTLAAGSTVTVTFASGAVTAPALGPASDTWRIISLATSTAPSTTQTTTVRTVVPGPDGEVPQPPPIIRLDINGNGGVCTPSFVEGEQGTWGKAPTADKCTFGSRQLQGFSTSPTLAPGSVFVPPGGSVYFLTDNLLYAIWTQSQASAPQDVVATAGLNSVKVTWKAPSDPGSSSITNYLAQATPSGKVCITRPTDANMLACDFNLPATNTKYAFKVQALNGAGWGPSSTESAAVSPYDFRDITASRPNVLLGLGGSRVEASGSAPGLAGKAVNAEFKVGSAKAWTTQANAAAVNAQGKFSWSRKFGPSLNKQNVTVRFTYGADLVSGTYVLARGGQAGSLTAPRNIKVENVVNKIKVSWDPPKFDGGEKITGYTICAVPGRGGTTCRSETGTEGTFWNLNTRQTYTITVSAKTAEREGPVGKSAKTVDPTEASISAIARRSDELTMDVRGKGFKKNSRFRVEVASLVPGTKSDNWAWDEVTSFREDEVSFRNTLRTPLDASLRGERLYLRLFTPTGTVYSRSIGP